MNGAISVKNIKVDHCFTILTSVLVQIEHKEYMFVPPIPPRHQ